MHRWTVTLAVVLATGLIAGSTAHAATIEVVGGTAVFTAAPGEVNDVQAGGTSGPVLSIADAGAPLTVGSGCTAVDAHTAVCPEASAGALPLLVDLRDGADRLREEEPSDRDVTIHAGAGDDVLVLGTSSNFDPVVDAGAGDDTVTINTNGSTSVPVVHGGRGDDSLSLAENGGGLLYGDQGDDHLHCSCVFFGFGSTPFRLDGGAGNDSYSFGLFLDTPTTQTATTIVPGPGFDTLDRSNGGARGDFSSLSFEFATCPHCVQRVIGTPAADRYTGDGGAQTILGGDGDDVLDGGGGRDVLRGQAGDDTINARDGAKDVVDCGSGTDTVTADHKDVVSSDCEHVDRAAPLN